MLIPPRYPDPDRVVYPTGYPPGPICQLTTRDGARIYPLHNHDAWTDKSGNGNTGVDAGHYHKIVNFRVIADASDGHTHQLTNLPCGAAAPHDVVPAQDAIVPAGVRWPGAPVLSGPPAAGGSAWKWVVGGLLVVGVVVGALMLFNKGEEAEDE